MTVVMSIQNRKAISNIQNVVNMFPVAVEKAANDIGKSAVRRVRREIKSKGLVDTWTLYNSVKWNEKKKELYIRRYGVMLDSQRPHYVKLKKGRRIRGWFERKARTSRQAKDFMLNSESSIFVRSHPFIRAPLRRTINDTPRIIKRRTRRVVTSRGRRT